MDDHESTLAQVIDLNRMQYEHALSELSRLDSQLHKFGTIATAFVTALFTLGGNPNAEVAYALLPFLVAAAMQYFIATAYSLVAIWISAYRYETTGFGQVSAPKPFFARYVASFLVDNNRSFLVLAPPYLLAIMVAVGAGTLTTFSAVKGHAYLTKVLGHHFAAAFVVASIVCMSLPYLSLLWCARKCNRMMKTVDKELEEV